MNVTDNPAASDPNATLADLTAKGYSVTFEHEQMELAPKPTRANDQGGPCPGWCTTDHGKLVYLKFLGKEVPMRQHTSDRDRYLDGCCTHNAGSHWEIAEPGSVSDVHGPRTGCAVLGCPCAKYDPASGGAGVELRLKQFSGTGSAPRLEVWPWCTDYSFEMTARSQEDAHALAELVDAVAKMSPHTAAALASALRAASAQLPGEEAGQ
jgi:hypothetical protein